MEDILNNIRKNCIVLSKKHTQNYMYYKDTSKYFKIPIIVLSVFSGSFAVGSDVFLHQELISVVSCGISMVITIISSIELYMRIIDQLEVNRDLSVKYKVLSLDIYKILSLPIDQRGIDTLVYLNEAYSSYIKLIESSDIMQIGSKDNLLHIAYDDESCSSIILTDELSL